MKTNSKFDTILKNCKIEVHTEIFDNLFNDYAYSFQLSLPSLS